MALSDWYAAKGAQQGLRSKCSLCRTWLQDAAFRLCGLKLAVSAVLPGNQLGMAAAFDDVAVVHDQDAVGIRDRPKPMRNNKRRAAAREIRKRRGLKSANQVP